MTGDVVLGILLKGSLVLGGGAAAAALLRRASAAVRHGILVAALAAAVALPALTLLLPTWTVPVFEPAPAPAPTLLTSPVPDDAGTVVAPADPAPAGITIDRRQPAAATTAPAALPALLALWGLGSLFVLARFATAVARTTRLGREAVEATVPLATRTARIARRLGIRHPVRVVIGSRLPVPATWGILRPIVALPVEVLEWPPDRLQAVLLHELAHVRRRDGLSVALAEVATAVWWFHPLAWVCARWLRIERERACDDVVLMAGTPPESYALLLVELARRTGNSGVEVPRPALAMSRPSTLRDRVETILTPGCARRSLGRRVVLTGVIAAVAVVLPLASVHLWGETTDAGETARRIAQLADPDPRTREAAAWALGARAGERAVEPLLARLADGDARVRGVAARSLGRIGGARATEGLGRALHDPHPRVRELAILGLVQHPAATPAALIVPLLDDPEMGVRSVAVHALSELGGAHATEALARAALHDPDPHTRLMAISGLGVVRDGESGLPVLTRLLEDPDPMLRAGAAKALTGRSDPRFVDALVARVGTESDADVRELLVHALAGFGDDRRAVAGLVAALGDRDQGVRVAAAEALGGSRSPRAVPALLGALHDPVHQVRLTAAWALDALEERAEGR